jgi:hypothetical protein
VAGAAYDRYGGDRAGDNLYGSSLVAVEAKTGKYLWHFQTVHHDIWDIDMQGAPVLFDAKIDGKVIPAVSVTSKNGLLFMFDRVTGKPLHPIEEKPFPKSEAHGRGRLRRPSRFRLHPGPGADQLQVSGRPGGGGRLARAARLVRRLLRRRQHARHDSSTSPTSADQAGRALPGHRGRGELERPGLRSEDRLC